MKLYTHSPSPNCIKVMAVAHYLQIPLEEVEMEPHSGACRSHNFLKKNPNGLLPTLEDGDYYLWESNAILVYLAQKAGATTLLPTDLKGQAELWRWMSWGMCHWGPAIRPLMYEWMVQPLIHHRPTDHAAVDRAVANFHPLARILDEHLSENLHMLGEALTLADFSLGSWLAYTEMARIPLADYPAITSWHKGLAALPAWQKALPKMQPPQP